MGSPLKRRYMPATKYSDPLAVNFTGLYRMVAELSDFSDDPQESNESKLEAIQ